MTVMPGTGEVGAVFGVVVIWGCVGWIEGKGFMRESAPRILTSKRTIIAIVISKKAGHFFIVYLSWPVGDHPPW
jgi:hypothetical protein